jgi:hypothetical protein
LRWIRPEADHPSSRLVPKAPIVKNTYTVIGRELPFKNSLYCLAVPQWLFNRSIWAEQPARTAMHSSEPAFICGSNATNACTFLPWMLSQPRAVRGKLDMHAQICQIPCFLSNSTARWQDETSHLEQRYQTFRNLWSGEERRPSVSSGAWLVLGGRTNTSFS